MSNATLTSLAMLKVSIDQGNDYFDYLRPFVLHVLFTNQPDPVTDQSVADLIHDQFGLTIPNKTIQLVVKRLAKNRDIPLKRDHGIYRIRGELPDPEIPRKRNEAESHINSVVQGLVEYSKTSAQELPDPDRAITALCAFLSNFDIHCLSFYLRGTTIPELKDSHDTDIVLVSDYVIHLQQSNPERFKSLLLMVQGHMLANALLCPDLRDLPRSYANVTFYFDTPLLIHSIGVAGEAKEAAATELIRLLLKLGGKVGTFSHSRDELENVLYGAAANLNNPQARGNIVIEARRNGTTKSDLKLLAAKVDELLEMNEIVTLRSPEYSEDFQIDENAFEQTLDDEVSYYNERAKEFDINSVRSIHALRKDTTPSSIENSGAILVTSNSSFSKAAWNFGQEYDASRQVSSVITDYCLANLAWLKSPMEAEEIPTTELLAISYAALQPSNKFLNRFLTEIDKLREKGSISARDHQLLRSGKHVYKEIMSLTLGDEECLTEETIVETLDRVSREIKREESEQLATEKMKHQQTQENLNSVSEENLQLKKSIYERCKRSATVRAWITTSVIFLLLLVGAFSSFEFATNFTENIRVFSVATVLLVIFTLGNLVFGITLKKIHRYLLRKFLAKSLEQESAAFGIDLCGNENNNELTESNKTP